jgi:predicted regulator of Ras-like GTPase activity (Roadblock/LC7/MglB family)
VAKLDLVMFEEEFKLLQEITARLAKDAQAKVVFLVDKNGQQIAAAGDVKSIDATSLASLTAGNVAATDGLAKLIGEKEFSLLFHEGEKDNLHISLVGRRGILVVIFDQNSSLALVRLRVKKTGKELQEIFDRVENRAQTEAATGGQFESPFSEITDEDIDKLFGD